MNMDAVAILNDAMGGVTVTVTEDFTDVDPTLTMGEVHLMGDQALTYIRTRKDVGDQLNVSRMKRHTEYVEGFMRRLMLKENGDAQFLVKLYDKIAPYIVTDCSVSTLSEMMERYGSYKLGTIVTPEGENKLGTPNSIKSDDVHYEFHMDAESLDAIVLSLLYAPKK
jgi:anionic cell wall polymer biosynthesis LytR-Cps2A-Psr (LCP) family protein